MNGPLIANIVLMYGILIGVNLPAPLLGLDFQEDSVRQRLWYEPPGYVIPIVWFVLFTLLGIARYELARRNPGGNIHWLITGLAILCATYAYYTLGLSKLTGVSALWFGLVGNVAVILSALLVAYQLGTASMTASLLVVPVAVWTVYATAIVIGELMQLK
ncbi:tryptophan-rich sensory protein [Oculatella sp. LEGE 06141]|uniref:tryptophan-rich sensory protein n=1 Tax=Oculatella sp. LEGE 06141 TaxID=1828648 RepID=UPI00187E35AC|nr:tryptophan-rich sensory protein [Oculatella sp. LEGE 06141]MBE9178573.1 tryptophan-rich sensory protein [Oculatella sp. LEGE 06141]